MGSLLLIETKTKAIKIFVCMCNQNRDEGIKNIQVNLYESTVYKNKVSDGIEI